MRRERLNQVEFVSVGGQDRKSRLRRGQEDQCVGQAFLALMACGLRYGRKN